MNIQKTKELIDGLKEELEINAGRIAHSLQLRGIETKDHPQLHQALLTLAHLLSIEDYVNEMESQNTQLD
jgi:hypothetical protein